MNRRDLLKFFAAGGLVVAGELWMPGAKAIFLPPERIFIRTHDANVLNGYLSVSFSKCQGEKIEADILWDGGEILGIKNDFAQFFSGEAKARVLEYQIT